MISFKQFIEEAKKGSLHVVDIDDTLFHTTAKVRVRNYYTARRIAVGITLKFQMMMDGIHGMS